MLWQWSPTAANNATAATNINWAEGQAPSTVNDSARQMMADVAADLMGDREWLKFGDTPTYVNGTQLTVPGNLTARYPVGRRVRASVTAGTVYGTITASAYTSLTTITLALDSGALDSGLSEVDVGILNPAFSSMPGSYSGLLQLSGGQNWTSVSWGRALRLAPINAIEFAGGVGNSNFGIGNSGGTLYFLNVPDEGTTSAPNYVLTVASNGNVTASGVLSGSNITGTSDERLKEDWRPMARDFIERMAGVLHGTFAWVNGGPRSAGVGAQSMREVFPEAVHEAEDGTLSVAYGHAALVTVLELIPLVLRLLDERGETP
jgi:hypothetical protein